MNKLFKENNFKQSIMRFFRKSAQVSLAVSTESDGFKTLYDALWVDIKSGLDFGYDIKHYSFGSDKYSITLSEIYKDYFGRKGTESEINIVFEALTTKVLNMYLDSYDKKEQLELTTGEDENGKFFEIKYKD